MKCGRLSTDRLIGLRVRVEHRRDGHRHLISTGRQHLGRGAGRRGVSRADRRTDTPQIRCRRCHHLRRRNHTIHPAVPSIRQRLASARHRALAVKEQSLGTTLTSQTMSALGRSCVDHKTLEVTAGRRCRGVPVDLSAGALAVLAPRPAAWPALAFFELLLGPPNAALSGHLLLGILDPADELVTRQGSDVLPGSKCRGVGGQRVAQVCG